MRWLERNFIGLVIGFLVGLSYATICWIWALN